MGKANEVSLVRGRNADEVTLVLNHTQGKLVDYRHVIERRFPVLSVRLFAPNPGKDSRSAGGAVVAFNAELCFPWNVWSWATFATRTEGDQVYLQEFTRAPPYLASTANCGLGATHGMEGKCVFDHLAGGTIDWAAADGRLAATPEADAARIDIHGKPVADVAPLRGIS